MPPRTSRTGVLQLNRRDWLRWTGSGVAFGACGGFGGLLTARADELRRQGRSLILLWMAGGPSQFETFDPKPGHQNGGETKSIATAVPGIQIAEHWPRMAAAWGDVALIRSMSNKEGNHQRASYQLHTGYLPSGSVKHPHLGSAVAQQAPDFASDLPRVISIGRTDGAGFLGVDFEPFLVDNPGQSPQNLAAAAPGRLDRRLRLLSGVNQQFASRGASEVVKNQEQLYAQAARLVRSPAVSAFEFNEESADTRVLYGDSRFGRGCLLARRLVEAGVSVVEVRADGWDTHQDNFDRAPQLARQIDPACAGLLTDLKQRGLLEKTLVVWAGEFGRTPTINARGGRDHYPRAFNCWLAGGGVRGGQVIGATTADGASIASRPVSVPDLHRSICHALRVNADHENISPLGRPMKIVDGGSVVEELFTG